MSQSGIEELPDELIMLIVSSLPMGSLTKLVQTSRRFNALVIPKIWEDLELHTMNRHRALTLEIPPPLIGVNDRPYLDNGRGNGSYIGEYDVKYTPRMFLLLLRQNMLSDQARLELLCSRVKKLCTTVEPRWYEPYEAPPNPAYSIWLVFPKFVNLEVLQLEGSYDSTFDSQLIPRMDDPPLPNLRCVKLSGYIPRELAAWLLRSRMTLQRVELGMLDRPIASNSNDRRYFPGPFPSENLSFSEGGGDTDSDYGSLNGDCVVPRPLTGFMLSFDSAAIPQEGTSFPALKHLYLSQPSRCVYEENGGWEYSWSTRAENACLADWKAIILASNATLEVLVLEQRPCAEQIELEGLSSTEWLSGNVLGVGSSTGVGSESLVQMILDCLETADSLPCLREVYLYGLAIGKLRKDLGSNLVLPGARLMRCLQDRGIRCEARLGHWMVFDGEDGRSFRDDWYEDDDEEHRSKYNLLAKV